MKKLAFGISLVLAGGALAISSGQVFKGAFEEAQAKRSDKLLLVDFTQSRG